jgi:hypothetical protein
METTLQRTTTIILGMGSLMFLVAAFMPYSRVFAEPDAGKKLAIILELKKMWTIGQVLFGLGAVVTVVGLGLLSYGFRDIPAVRWAYLGTGLMFVGSLLWCWHLWERTIDPETFANGMYARYLFTLYSIFTQLGLVLVGILLLKSCLPNWIGWMFIMGSGLFFLLMVIFRDMPPFVYYVLTLIAAIVLLTSTS